MNWKALFSKFGLTKQSTDNTDDFNPWLPLQMKLNAVYKVTQSHSAGYLIGKPTDRPPNLWWIVESLIPEFEQSCTTVIQQLDGNVEWDLYVAPYQYKYKDDGFFLRISPKKFREYLDKPLSNQDFEELQQKYPRINKFNIIYVREQEFGESTGSFCSEAFADVPRLVDSLLKI
jgi:hypothetical protein